MNIDWNKTGLYVGILLGIAGIINFIAGGFGRKEYLAEFAKWFLRLFTSQSELRRILIAQNKTLEKIQLEVTSNGGSSLKDDVGKLRQDVGAILTQQSLSLSREWCDDYLKPYPIFQTDTEGSITFLNKAWLDMIGCHDETLVMGKGYLNYLFDEDVKKAIEQNARLKDDPAPYEGPFTFKHMATGKRINTIVTSQLIKDGKGKIIGTFGTLQILNN